METRVESELKDLKSRILAMGGFVEQAVEKATQALADRDIKKIDEVMQIEGKINEAHIEVDRACMEALARIAPVATDLRVILSIIKINSDLERMGDQAVNISRNTGHYIKDRTLELSSSLPQMAIMVKEMVRSSLDAFMREDVSLAQQVLKKDDAVDEMKNKMFRSLKDEMKKNPQNVDAALDLLLISRNLERLGDHATNIAEDVIFAYTGEDVRHGVSAREPMG